MCPAWELQLEAAVGPVFPMQLEVETPRVVPFLQGPKVALVGPPGFPNPLACPSPYAIILGPNLKAPIRCQVWKIYLYFIKFVLYGKRKM